MESGHKCVGDVGECTDEDGNPINGAGTDPVSLTHVGNKMHDLFSYYASKPDGPWNSNGGAFTPADFLAWMLMIECKGNVNCLKYSMQAWSAQLWGTGIDAQGNVSHQPYCPSSPCANGVFNFLGVYSESAMKRYNALIFKNYNTVEQLPANYSNYGNAGYTVQNIGNDVVVNPLWMVFNNDVPVHTGNYIPNVFGPPWVENLCNDTQMFTNAMDGIVYIFKGENGVYVVIHTINQAAYWSSRRPGMCGK